MKRLIGAAFALLAWTGSARAETPFDLYEQGKYDAAIEAGLAQNDAAGYAIAARSELAAEAMRAIPCLECLQRAERDAHKSILLDRSKPEPHIYRAVALGNQARIIGIIEAGAHHYAWQAKAELESALKDDPNNAYAWAASGGWNIEIVRNGGTVLAGMLYNATVDEGLKDFNKAFALDPDSVVLRYQYALSLSGLDLETYRAKVDDALKHATNGKPKGAYEIFVQKRSKQLLEALHEDDLGRYAEMVHRDQGYPP